MALLAAGIFTRFWIRAGPWGEVKKDMKITSLNIKYLFISYNLLFFNDTATTEIYTLSLHDALPIYTNTASGLSAFIGGGDENVASSDYATVAGGLENLVDVTYGFVGGGYFNTILDTAGTVGGGQNRSGEHTSELPSPCKLRCRLLL